MSSRKTMDKINVVAPLYAEAAKLSEVSTVLQLPPEEQRQPDLQYLTAIFVSSGMNKNGAVFLGSELVKAQESIIAKAVDFEHDEQFIIGQITGSVYLNKDRTLYDLEAASAKSAEDLDEEEMDIAISAIVHKARFPQLAQEINEGKWMVSMEAYYRDYDVKVGDLIITREKAEELGYDKMVGSVVKLRDGGKELGFHLVGRVLRDIHFAGVGIVKNPANTRSIIMEAAAMNDYVEEKAREGDVNIIDLADIRNSQDIPVDEENKVLASEKVVEYIRETVFEAVSEALKTEAGNKKTPENKEEARDFLNHILPGTCVSYKRYVYAYPEDRLVDPAEDLTQYPLYTQPGDSTPAPGEEVSREHWCSLFDLECTSRPGDATHPQCWRNVFARTVREEIDSYSEVLRRRRIAEGLVDLQRLIDEAKKFEQ